MTIEEYLGYTAGLDWMTAAEIGNYLDGLGLWPEDTPKAVKIKDIVAGLRAEAAGFPLVARLKRDDGPWLYKQEKACTQGELAGLVAFYEAQAEAEKTRATEARDVAVQQGEAHRVLPWEETPGL